MRSWSSAAAASVKVTAAMRSIGSPRATRAAARRCARSCRCRRRRRRASGRWGPSRRDDYYRRGGRRILHRRPRGRRRARATMVVSLPEVRLSYSCAMRTRGALWGALVAMGCHAPRAARRALARRRETGPHHHPQRAQRLGRRGSRGRGAPAAHRWRRRPGDLPDGRRLRGRVQRTRDARGVPEAPAHRALITTAATARRSTCATLRVEVPHALTNHRLFRRGAARGLRLDHDLDASADVPMADSAATSARRRHGTSRRTPRVTQSAMGADVAADVPGRCA